MASNRITFAFYVFAIAAAGTILYACYRCSCNCRFCSGCTTIVARTLQTDSLVAKKTFCTVNNMYKDQNFIDSCDNFKGRYSAFYKITLTDSTYNCSEKKHITCEESEKYPTYRCQCAK